MNFDGNTPFDPAAMFGGRQAALDAMIAERNGAEISAAQTAMQLRDSFAVLTTHYDFLPGDLLQLKKGIETGTFPPRGGVVIYIRRVDNGSSNYLNCVGDHEAGSIHGASMDDIVIGILSRDGALAMYRADSRFYEPAKIDLEDGSRMPFFLDERTHADDMVADANSTSAPSYDKDGEDARILLERANAIITNLIGEIGIMKHDLPRYDVVGKLRVGELKKEADEILELIRLYFKG